MMPRTPMTTAKLGWKFVVESFEPDMLPGFPTGRYVVPTGRVIATVSIKVPTGRYIVPAGYIVPTGRTN
ncbi:hypothetical protein Tco_1049328 [Tanacetum coccineum]